MISLADSSRTCSRAASIARIRASSHAIIDCLSVDGGSSAGPSTEHPQRRS